MTDFPDVQARHVWRATLYSASLNACLMPFEVVLSRGVTDIPWWPAVGSSAVGAAIAVFVMRVHWRRPQSLRLGTWLFVLNNAVILAAMWVTAPYHLRNPHLAPLQAHKLGTLAVAILAPQRWAGIACILGFVALPIVELAFFDPTMHAMLGWQEAMVLAIYGTFALVLLFFRVRSLDVERKLVRAQTEATDARQSARVLMAVRDLSNTPLQSIEFASAILRRHEPEEAPSLDRIDRALDRLRSLHRPLKVYESDLEWRPGDESFDPESVLAKAAAEVKARSRRSV
ncbi:MAG: hypothetical protein HOV80_37795 [Polyangiaceae bacterium]|nr:hypothetical protein [Polyangiaceae bacterium]